MITIVSSTNRPESKSAVVAEIYAGIMRGKGADAKVLSLQQLPKDFITHDMYGERTGAMSDIIEEYLVQADKLVFIIPEYNGSYPGILKTFIDAIGPRVFRGKKAGIIGISDGHAGNIRGQEHLTGVLHHLRMMVHFSQPKLSHIDGAINEENQITDLRAIRLLNEHADFMLAF
jgi:chromate reductase